MGKLVGEGLQLKFNGKLLSELASKRSRRMHWLPEDRVAMEQWLRASHTAAFLNDSSDACLSQLALKVGIDFQRLNTDQKQLVKAKMCSSLKYTLNKLKVSGEVSEKWDPRGEQVILDWTQSAGDSPRGLHDDNDNSPCPAHPTHHLTPRIFSTDNQRGRAPETSHTPSSKEMSQIHSALSSSSVRANSLDDDLERDPEEFYRQNDHLDQPPPYSVQANLVETDLQRATEEFYRHKAHLDKLQDLMSPRYKAEHQDALAQCASAVPDTRRHGDREVELSMGRGQAARKETTTTDQALDRGRNQISLEPRKTSPPPLTPEMAERKSPALHESNSTKAHRKFIQQLREGSHIPGPMTKNAKGMIPAADEAVWTRADDHFWQRLVNTSVPDTPPVPKRSVAGNRALRQKSYSNSNVLQRLSHPDQPQSPTRLYNQPSLVYPHPDLVNGVEWTFGMWFCVGLLVLLLLSNLFI